MIANMVPQAIPIPRKLPFRRRLHRRFYLALLASLTMVIVVFGLTQLRIHDPLDDPDFSRLAASAQAALPPAGADARTQRNALHGLRKRIDGDVSLYAPDGRLIARSGRNLPALDPAQARGGWRPQFPSIFALRLTDGRWLQAQHQRAELARYLLLDTSLLQVTIDYGAVRMIVLLIVIAMIVALGAYPVIRRATRRIERLRDKVEAWGEGALSLRFDLKGSDEVARLAASFNEAAERIEALVSAQKSLLANASHELRSPLARVRMAVELMGEQAPPALRGELDRHVTMLDQLIEEVLLASRLEALGEAGMPATSVDLTAIAAEECARTGAQFAAPPASVAGDPVLLRRMLRKLLDHAARTGAGRDIKVTLHRETGRVRLDVCNGGPALSEVQRERLFEPFYRLPSEDGSEAGLGLSLVRQIAHCHGGAATCVAGAEGGICLRVSLPMPVNEQTLLGLRA